MHKWIAVNTLATLLTVAVVMVVASGLYVTLFVALMRFALRKLRGG